MWPANKIFGEDKVQLQVYRRELARLNEEEKIAQFRCNLLDWGTKKSAGKLEDEKVTVRVADQHGDGLINMIAGDSVLGHGVAFVMRLVGKLTDRGTLKVAVGAPISVIEAGSKKMLDDIRSRKRIVQYEIERLEHKLHPESRPRVSVPENLVTSGETSSPDTLSPYPRR